MPHPDLINKNKQAIIERIASGETATSIGLSLGYTSHATISTLLANDPEYIQAKEHFHKARLDKVEQAILDAPDMFELVRADKFATSVRWRAERECREVYGKDTVQTQAQAPVFNVVLVNNIVDK